MNGNKLIDLLLIPVAILGVIFTRKSIENNIKKNFDFFNNDINSKEKVE